MVTRDFQSWYDWKKFRSPNEHGIWNGMNLMGFDPLDFLDKLRARRVNDFQDYFAQMQPAVRVRIAIGMVPDFVARYPSLLTKPLPPTGLVAGWEITCNWTGLPFAWTPLTPAEVTGLAPNRPLRGSMKRWCACSAASPWYARTTAVMKSSATWRRCCSSSSACAISDSTQACAGSGRARGCVPARARQLPARRFLMHRGLSRWCSFS